MSQVQIQLGMELQPNNQVGDGTTQTIIQTAFVRTPDGKIYKYASDPMVLKFVEEIQPKLIETPTMTTSMNQPPPQTKMIRLVK